MNVKINRLKEIMNNSDDIVFFGDASVFPLKMIYQTSQEVMVYTIVKVR